MATVSDVDADEAVDPNEASVLAAVDELLATHPPETTDANEFLRAQYDAGLAWLHFPEGFGGRGISMGLQSVVDDRLRAAGAPPNGRMLNPTNPSSSKITAKGSRSC